MAMVWLVWMTVCLLIGIPHSDCGTVKCFSQFNWGTSGCEHLLGDVDEDDCCMNLKYAFTGPDGACKYCGYAQWTSWSLWSSCSVSCKEGVTTRRRQCHGLGCPGDKLDGSVEMKPCSDKECCPEQGRWAAWGPWQQCSVTCESGTRRRERTCSDPKPKCDGTCDGSVVETESCSGPQCPIHGGWAAWAPWRPCSSSCAVEGRAWPVKERLRTCTNPSPSLIPPGHHCSGRSTENEECTNLPFCPVDGAWGPWRGVDCSVTCGVGHQTEQRECNNPAAKHGGRDCPGSTTQNLICIKDFCPVDGQWAGWSAWGPCESRYIKDIKCKKISGIHRRNRYCQYTAYGGKPCDGPLSNTADCFNIEKCQAKLSEWSEWSLCKPICAQEPPKRMREWSCQPDLSAYEKVNPEADFTGTAVVKGCSVRPIPQRQEMPCLNVPPCPIA